jgi:hypothetical protein
MWRIVLTRGIIAAAIGASVLAAGPAGARAAEKKGDAVYTDPAEAGPDLAVQGEYEGTIAGGGKFAAQTIVLGGDAFQAVFYRGGLPGAGWDKSERIALDGKTEGGRTVFAPSEAKKKYLGKAPEEFSALKSPPAKQPDWSATIADGRMTGKTDKGEAFDLRRTVRESPTLGAKPPAGAIVLFDGTGKDAWTGGRVDETKKTLCTDGRDIKTNQKFLNYTMHVEFLLPFRPAARGQGRGNSGFYQADLYEVQILDSFGLEGASNECGGVYTKAAPQVNMCLPPLQWQTYDVDFQSAQADAGGAKTKNAVITLRHNGVVIHENFEINGKTGGARNEPEGTPGPIKLQGHGNPLQFRNIWIVQRP